MTLKGPIPETLGNLRNLEFLSMAFNQLSGPIPDFFGALTKLRQAYLGSNALSGGIPPSLCRLEALISLVRV